MNAIIENRQKDIPLPEGLEEAIERAVGLAVRGQGLPGTVEVSLSLVSDDEIRRLNREYRGIDAPTDVLAFPLLEKNEIAGLATAMDGRQAEDTREQVDHFTGGAREILLGDVVISLQQVSTRASHLGHSLTRETVFLAVHGVLHLLGYDHDTPQGEELMEGMTESILEQTRVGGTSC